MGSSWPYLPAYLEGRAPFLASEWWAQQPGEASWSSPVGDKVSR